MKETLRPIQPRELTSTLASPRLNGGVLFMAEPGNSEATSVSPARSVSSPEGRSIIDPSAEHAARTVVDEIAAQGRIGELRRELEEAGENKTKAQVRHRTISPERIERARSAWESRAQAEGRELTELEKELIAAGVPPVAGGQDIIDVDTLTTEKAKDVARRWNEDIARGKVKDTDYIEQREIDIQRIMDTDTTVSREDFNRILQNMDGWYDQAREQADRARQQQMEERTGGFGQRLFTSEEKRLIVTGKSEDDEKKIDALFNSIFTSLDSRPKDEFREAFGVAQYEYEEFLRTLSSARVTADRKLVPFLKDEDFNDLINNKDDIREKLQERIDKYTAEKNAREIIHNANYVLLEGIGTEDLNKFIRGFQAGYADLVYSKKGVVSAMHCWEQAMLVVREKGGGYLPNEAVVGNPEKGERSEVEKLARQYLQGTEYLEQWEEDRAISIARGMSIITGRSIEIAASSTLPPDNALISLYAQDIIKDLAPFRHLLGKFNIGEEALMMLGYLLKRKRKGWNWIYKELEELEHKGHKEIIKVVDGLVKEEDERFLGILNPFRVGSLFTRTTWRVTAPQEDNPIPTLLDRIPKDEQHRIGTGVIIEKNRGKLNDPKAAVAQQAKRDIGKALDRVSNLLPAKLFLNMRDIKRKVLMARGIQVPDNENELVGFHNADLEQDLNDLVVLQEKAVRQQVDRLEDVAEQQDDPTRMDPARRDRAETLAQQIRNAFTPEDKNKFIENLKNKDWRVPYVFGTEDLPYNRYHFGSIGGTGIVRIWRDNASATKAAAGIAQLIEGIPTFQNPESVVEKIAEVHNGIAGYDKGFARKFTKDLAEGVIKMYSKDYYHRLPFGIGVLLSYFGKASYAETAFGTGAMAWNEFQVSKFTGLLRRAHFISEAEQHELQAKAGGGRGAVAYAFFRTAIPLILAGLALYMSLKLKSEK